MKRYRCQIFYAYRYNIPTADFETFTDYNSALAYVSNLKDASEIVIKASCLAGGKGVILPSSLAVAKNALKEIMVDEKFSGDATVVIETRLDGPEVSLLYFCDGYSVRGMPAAQDHKRVGEGDIGPNTGGMGAYAPAPCLTPTMAQDVLESIVMPTVKGMRQDGCPFVGILYVGM
jgi:phosphoribosylamine--glycine ligase/phosphoribosylformylglycinamidine cyclo-ligase